MISENHIEKKFLYLILFSLLAHSAVFALIAVLPEEKRAARDEPFMVDLSGIPVLPPVMAPDQARRFAETPQRVEREISPKGEGTRDQLAPQTSRNMLPQQNLPYPAQPSGNQQVISPSGEIPLRDRSPKEALFRKKGAAPAPDMTTLYPGAAKLERIEESFRKKYGQEVAEGDASFLNVDDIRFGSFLRRFETAVYGVWRYPAEAARMGIEGITPVKITFNRRGEIVDTELLQSSGSKILDTEVLRTLKQIGAVGAFPRGYDKDTFKLIAFFHYGITQGAVRSLR